ncbi:MFS general substrate transporter [Ascobolus immersus RN42]|uniref:MFS general substrate transporter n=1 Tax=Ascobolus immersus RN42 TaxID=1160509 RepID=A0A3N4HUL0_ASCIM|nr:MFS general substrate transporter [Ascobolus immersus RN42]
MPPSEHSPLLTRVSSLPISETDDDPRPPLLTQITTGTNGTFKNAGDNTDSDPEGRPLLHDDTAAGNGSSNGKPDEGKPKVNMWMILPAIAIGIMLSAMDNTIVVSSYGSIGSDLKELKRTSWIATSYLLTITSFQPLYGKLSDIFGRKPCLLLAYTIFGLGCLWCGLSTTMTSLILGRAFSGIGGGGMTTVASILLSDIVPLRQRGTWQGILNIIFATGSALGAPLGGILADSVGWRWGFLGQVPCTMLAFAMVAIFLHVPPHHDLADEEGPGFMAQIARVDFLGAGVLIPAVLTLLIGMDLGSNDGFTNSLVIAFLCGSVLLFLAFVLVEVKVSSEPFAPAHVIAERSILACCLANFFAFGSNMASLFYLPLYFQSVVGLSAGAAGARLLPSIAGGVSGSLLGGIIMQKTGRYYTLTVCSYLLHWMAVIPVLLCTGLVWTNYYAVAAGIAAMGFGNGVGVTSTLIGIIATAGRKDQAVGTAASYLFRSLGIVLGLGLASGVFQTKLRFLLTERLVGDGAAEIIEKVRQSLSYIKELDPATQAVVRGCYQEGIVWAFGVSFVFAGCAFASSVWIREKRLHD